MNAAVIECGPGKVPGWLDEHGDAQGCVDNNPTPGAPKDPVASNDPVAGVPADAVAVVQVAPTVPHYIETGVQGTGSSDWLALVLIAVAFVTGYAARSGRRK